MASLVIVTVLQSSCIYDKFVVSVNNAEWNVCDLPEESTKKCLKLHVNGIFLHYFAKELTIGHEYRNLFLKNFNKCGHDINRLTFLLIPVDKDIIDYAWNERTSYLIRERCELEHILSWLSTLGGAFSALGDYFVNYAEIAGKISLNQLKLAVRLGDRSVMSRCMLFLSLSLIQRNRYKLARKIINREYIAAKNEQVKDTRLINMCKGIWCKLRYEYDNYRNVKRTVTIREP